MTQQNPNKYRDNLPLLEKILKQYEANDLSRSDALSFLQEQGFNLPHPQSSRKQLLLDQHRMISSNYFQTALHQI